MEKSKFPISFVFRKAQSLVGLCLILFLFEHLFTTSQAVLFLGDGARFIKMVNSFQAIPHLKAIEITLIGIPFLFHIALGVKYISEGENSFRKTDGKTPSMKYGRNRAYVFQRITSYVIAVLLIFHVAQMRFYKSPEKVIRNNIVSYHVKLTKDKDLKKVAKKLEVKLISKNSIDNVNISQSKKYILKDNQMLAISPSFGSLMLLSVRDTLKNPIMVFLYSIFVIAASFHAINGLWTFLISWGVIISAAMQKKMLMICFVIMALLTALGFFSIWGSYLF